MKKITKLICFVAVGLLSSVGTYATTNQDTIATTVKGVQFRTLQTDAKHKVTVALYQGKEYTLQGSSTSYFKQEKQFGDCRVLIIGGKMVIL